MSKNNSDFFKEKNDWSVIKDKLLGCYLSPYFQKVLMTKKPIYYVDCFAGKGKFEDGNDGSPLIALKVREDCLKRANISFKNGAIQPCFIESDHAVELQQNVATFISNYGDANIISGKYEETILKCLSDKDNYNVFLYIDPYGIKALNFELFKKFKTLGFNSFEMLINFNSFGFFRDACRVMRVNYSNDAALNSLEDLIEYDPMTVDTNAQSEVLLNSIAGGDYWKDIVKDYKAGKFDGYKAEQILSERYKQQLKKFFSYVLDLPIRLKEGQRPKYRMMHVCNHRDGCFLMAQNMQKRKEELFLNIQQDGQFTIFDMLTGCSSTGEGDLITIEEIAEKVSQHLKGYNEIGLTEYIASFVNEYGLICDFKMIYDSLTILEQKKELQILRNPAHRKNGKKSAFWEECKDKTITLRRCKA
ncbi:MAG: three-Cys-motif partner protein TcmP [Clostridia bacterium]|nr:three-Cys-motif partner protein TcmP [Clostridia bacterium]